MFISLFLALTESFIITEPGEQSFSLEANGAVELELSAQFFNLFQFSSKTNIDVKIIQSNASTIEHFTNNSIFISETYVKIKNNNLENEINIRIWTGPLSICQNKGIMMSSPKSAYFQGELKEGMASFCIFNFAEEKLTTELYFHDKEGAEITFYRVTDLVGHTNPYICNAGCNYECSVPFFVSVSYAATKKSKVDVTVSGAQKTIDDDCYIKPIPLLGENASIVQPDLKVSISHEKCGFVAFSSNEILIMEIIFYVLVSLVVLIVVISIIVKWCRKPRSMTTKDEGEKFFNKKKESTEPAKETAFA